MAPKSKKHRSGGAARHRSIATTDSEDFSWNCLQKVVMRGAGATRISDKHCKEMQCSSKQYLNLISKRFVTRLISLAADYTKSRKSVTLNIKVGLRARARHRRGHRADTRAGSEHGPR